MNFLLNLSRLLDLQSVSNEVNSILSVWVGPLFVAIGGVGAVYIIILAVQYARSENDNKRAETKSRIVNCVIGVLSLLVIGALCIGLDWAKLVQMFGYAGKDAMIGILK